MSPSRKGSDPLENLTDEQIKNIGQSIDALDQEEARIIKEEIEEKEKRNVSKESFRRLKKSPLEIINRSLFFVFIGSFISSFFSVYNANHWWFLWYVTSAFSCILYSPNRKALKELLDAWPNIKDLLRTIK